MSARFEIVRTDVDGQPWHARLVVNGQVTWWTEQYARKVGAERAIVSMVREVTGAQGLRIVTNVPTRELIVCDSSGRVWGPSILLVDERAGTAS